jgi:hypothetical protein
MMTICPGNTVRALGVIVYELELDAADVTLGERFLDATIAMTITTMTTLAAIQTKRAFLHRVGISS